MKKRKVLFLLPVAALILSGCTFQEGWETVKGWTGSNIYEPVKNWVMKLLGQEEQKKEDKKDEEKGGGEQGGGEQGGGGEQETTKYGTLENPLTIAEAKEIIEEECLGDGDLTKQAIYCYGEIKTVYSTHVYDTGPAFELDVKDDEAEVYVYRVHGKEEDKANCKVGSIIHFHGFAKNYSGTLEFCDNGKNQCAIDSLAKPQGTEAVTGIEFDSPAYAVQVGKTINVTASVLPLNAGNQNYTLSLKDLSPAGCVELLEGNKLKGVAVGSAKVVATSEEGNFTAEATVTISEAINYGSLENPLTIAEAMAVINKENPTKEKVYVTGIVKSNKAYSTKYNNTEIWITDLTNDFELYGCNLPENFTPAQPVENDPALVGKEVIAHGTAKKYNSTYELDKGCSIDTLTDPVPIAIEEVVLSEQSLNLEVGDQASLSASVLPDNANQEVEWTVASDPATVEVAKYENGKVFALAEGTATVTATSVADSTKSASCTVNVSEATKELISIAIAGEAEKTVYNEDEAYSAAGLKVMAHYDKGDDVDVTADADIVLDKEIAAVGDSKFTVTATYGQKDATKDVAVTVNAVNQFIEAYNAALALQSGETEQYTFKGVIAAKRQDNEWFIQHEGYGIEYYGNNADFAVGKQVKVKATLQNYSGLPETKTIASGTVIGDGVMPTPVELASGADVEAAKLNVLANVTGTAKEDWSSYSAGSNATLKLVGSDNKDIDVFFKKNLFSAKESTLKAVKAGDTVTFTNVVTSIYTTRQILFVAGSDVQVTAAPAKEIASVTGVSGPSEVALGGTIAIDDVTVFVEYTDGSTGKGTVLSVTCDTSSAGEVEADVTIEDWNDTLHFTLTVTAQSVVYNKVISAPSDWSGTYILVSEDENVAWTGVDSSECVSSVTISNNQITNPASAVVQIEIASMEGGYSLKVVGGTNNGKYLDGKLSSGNAANGTTFNSSPVAATISYGTDSTIITSSKGTEMRYNSADTNGNWFRFYKTTSSVTGKVQLYKLAA